MNNNKNKASIKTAFCGIITALSVAIMFAGSLIPVLTYALPAIAGLSLIIVTSAMGRKAACTVFFCVSVISALLVPDKEAVVMYIAFFGYYPIIKLAVDVIKPKALSFIVKLLIFNASAVLSQLFVVNVLGIPLDASGMLGKWVIVILLVLANILLIIYDVAVAMIWRLYNLKWRKRFDKFLK